MAHQRVGPDRLHSADRPEILLHHRIDRLCQRFARFQPGCLHAIDRAAAGQRLSQADIAEGGATDGMEAEDRPPRPFAELDEGPARLQRCP